MKEGARVSKKVLTLLSEWGYWGEELIGPMEALEEAGYELVFATNKGKRAPALPPSMDSTFVDPPLGRPVVSEEMAKKVREIDSSAKLDSPINLMEWLPEKPYRSSATYLRDIEAYNNALDDLESEFDDYAALLIVGGSGPIVDLANNQRVHDIIMSFYEQNKPIGA